MMILLISFDSLPVTARSMKEKKKDCAVWPCAIRKGPGMQGEKKKKKKKKSLRKPGPAVQGAPLHSYTHRAWISLLLFVIHTAGACDDPHNVLDLLPGSALSMHEFPELPPGKECSE
eukprot:1156440-Pelagomonas_calceolata.AAC.2